MKSAKLSQILQDLGLSDHEAQVYLAALGLGSTTVLKIARETGIKRSTVYLAIDSLKQKGLINIEVRGFKKFIVAQDPEVLHNMIKLKKEELESALPELTALKNLKGGQSFIKYYEGLDNVKTVYDGLLQDVRPKEDYLVLADATKWIRLDRKYFTNFQKRRAKLNINLRMLLRDSKEARWHKKYEKNLNAKIKLLPPSATHRANLVIIPRRLVYHQLTPPVMAMVIENKSIIDMQREVFDMLWRSTK